MTRTSGPRLRDAGPGPSLGLRRPVFRPSEAPGRRPGSVLTRSALIAFSALPLVACASVYIPQPIAVYDPPAYRADVDLCHGFATEKYAPDLDLGAVLAGAGEGAGDSATGALVGGPAVIAVGAAGGATSKLSAGLDAFGQSRYNVERNCLLEITRRDRSALVADPR